MTPRRYYNIFTNETVTMIRVIEGQRHQWVEYQRDNPIADEAGIKKAVFQKPLYVWSICYRPIREEPATHSTIPVETSYT